MSNLSDIDSMNRFIGIERRRNAIRSCGKFHENYKLIKRMVKELQTTGECSTNLQTLPCSWEEKLLSAIPPITRKGMFNQFWVID